MQVLYSWDGSLCFVIGQKSQIKRRTSWLLLYIHPWLWDWHSMNTGARCDYNKQHSNLCVTRAALWAQNTFYVWNGTVENQREKKVEILGREKKRFKKYWPVLSDWRCANPSLLTLQRLPKLVGPHSGAAHSWWGLLIAAPQSSSCH